MKKKLLFLIPTCGIASFGAMVAPLVTSCSNGTEYVSIYKKENKLIGNSKTGTLVFNINRTLNNNQKLYLNVKGSTAFKFSQPQVWKNMATVSYTVNDDINVIDKVYSYSFEFTCKSLGLTIWSYKIDNIKLSYCSALSIKTGSKDEWTAEGVKHYDYTFELAEALPDNYEIKVNLERLSTSSSNIYGATALEPEISADRKSIKVTVGVYKQTGETEETPNFGDYLDFNLKFICNDENKQTYWSQSITNFKLRYSAEIREVNTEALVITDGVLTKIDWSLVTSGLEPNAIIVPAAVKAVDSNFWANSSNGHDTEMNKIENLTVAYSKDTSGIKGCVEFREECFAGATVKVIDLSQIPNEVQGLSTLLKIEPDTSGKGAFHALKYHSGAIKWNSEFSLYKKHLIKAKLYNAGMGADYTNWFDIVSVKTREQLVEAFDQGANVRLDNDIDISTNSSSSFTGQIDVYVGSILDLNGHKITASAPIYNTETEQYAMFTVWDYAELVVYDTKYGQINPDTGELYNGGIYPYDISEEHLAQVQHPEWSAYPTKAFDVRTEYPDRKQATLEIVNGVFYGNETVIQSRNCTVWIDGGDFHLYRPNYSQNGGKGKYLRWLDYDRILNCYDHADPTKANFQVFGGKFYGKYQQDAWNDYVDLTRNSGKGQYKRDKTFDFKTVFDQMTGTNKMRYETVYDPKEDLNVVDQTKEEIDKDECFYNPFFTYSEPDRIVTREATSGAWTTSWAPTIYPYSSKTDFQYNFIYHKHDANNENYVEVSYIDKRN